MDLGRGLGVKEGLDGVPEEPEPLPGIDDEHPAQRLRIGSKLLTVSFRLLVIPSSFVNTRRVIVSMIPLGSCLRRSSGGGR
jgi:hypothetical protein